MNSSNRLRRQHSTNSSRPISTTPIATPVPAQCLAFVEGRRSMPVVVGPFAKPSSTPVDADTTMAASVVVLERFQQQPFGHHHRPHHRAHNKYASVSAGSALSKSMRYADEWLYDRSGAGTVGYSGRKARSTFLGREQFDAAAVAALVIGGPASSAVAEDPYDRVRKNRMASPATSMAVDSNRNRSCSPRTPSPDYDDTGGGRGANGRRSILECNVNPYDLLRPSCDDDESPKRMSLKDKFMNKLQDSVFPKRGLAAKKGHSSSTCSSPTAVNGGVNIAGHTVRLFDGKSPSSDKRGTTSSVWYDDGSTEDNIQLDDDKPRLDVKTKTVTSETLQNQSPVRPPRRRCKPTGRGQYGSAKRSHSLTAGITPSSEIKSILKKPASLTTDDLSPVRTTKTLAVPTAKDAVLYSSTSQKKTKKQVQFDIEAPSTVEESANETDVREEVESAVVNGIHQNNTKDGKFCQDDGITPVLAAAVERKLKRSLSDRQSSSNGPRMTGASDVVTVFNDTMRIHVRHKSRLDSRLAFDRPTDPPPLPPLQSTSENSTAAVDSAITELFLDGGNAKTVVQVSPPGDNQQSLVAEQKTSILVNTSSPGRLKTSVIIGEGGSAYAATSDNKVTISIGPTNGTSLPAGNNNAYNNYKSNVTLGSATNGMAEFIRLNYDPVLAARLEVTPHVCGRPTRARRTSTLVDPYRVSDINKHAEVSDTDDSSESCYASAKEDASYSSTEASSLHYNDSDPIYEEIPETPPPLPSCPPPDRSDHDTAALPSRSIFEGATKYDIINYLVDAKRRCCALQDAVPHPKFVVVGDEQDTAAVAAAVAAATEAAVAESDSGNGANCSDSSSEEYGHLQQDLVAMASKKASVDIERNDSGVGSETSQSSRSKWQQQHETQHSCEDCDQAVEVQTTDGGIMFAPLVCRKCHKRRAERREIIAEIVETEEKYGRDLDIVMEEFYRPMMVAGLLNADQLSAVFLNVAELREHSAALSQKLRDAYEIAVEQGDDDLLTVNIGRLFLEASPSMLHAFQSYCTRQGNAALLLANLEKEKELLRIFLRVSQMENAVLRRMNLNSFLMVPVQRVTKYPLLLARLCKVTPEHHLEARQTLNEARHKIQLHLEHINSLAKDISSTKLWRKIYAINGKRPDSEDLADIKFRKAAVDVLEWSGLGEEIRFAVEGRLLYTQPSDNNWRRAGRTIKLMPINAIIVTLGKPNDNYNPDSEDVGFPRQNGIRDASLVLLKEKGGRISLLREPMYLDRCVICCENELDDYFELHEITTKDTYILKGQDTEQTKLWYRQLQYHCQTLGCWRKRRNALANIMINRNCT
ncbi:uncharacterized protein LOC126838447 [Adelges cooleyi]|uniref:uncharacterized protein LOC126838447 n=1 Tax=Adelges cooleyi TaxID=133065 RepID=UPI0021808FD0|nr:uncharacterized protein LOC126838447 [Adelges cooleyi]XP_050428813.1 uncharacterized protein LOC126838447 [Adelges cooleyi]